MTSELLEGSPADADSVVVEEAVRALWDGKPRRIEYHGQEVVGRVWEVYRSITTSSLRIRWNDEEGRVYHANSHDVTIGV